MGRLPRRCRARTPAAFGDCATRGTCARGGMTWDKNRVRRNNFLELFFSTKSTFSKTYSTKKHFKFVLILKKESFFPGECGFMAKIKKQLYHTMK